MPDFEYFSIAEWRLMEWEQIYAPLNVHGELLKMKEWLTANPRRRKKNYNRFIINWLNKEHAKIQRQAIEARSYARVGKYEQQHHATPERAQEVLEMIERQRKQHV
jgi:hypothetical protein